MALIPELKERKQNKSALNLSYCDRSMSSSSLNHLVAAVIFLTIAEKTQAIYCDQRASANISPLLLTDPPHTSTSRRPAHTPTPQHQQAALL